MSGTSNTDTDFPTLPPEQLLQGNYGQIEAGLNCIDDVDILMKYMAYENAHQNRTPIQELIRTKIIRVRKATEDTGGGQRSNR